MFPGVRDPGFLSFSRLFNNAHWIAEYIRIFRYYFIARNQGCCADKGTCFNSSVVENNAAHPDQDVIFNVTAMQNTIVTDSNAIANADRG